MSPLNNLPKTGWPPEEINKVNSPNKDNITKVENNDLKIPVSVAYMIGAFFFRPSVIHGLFSNMFIPAVYSLIAGGVFHANSRGEHLGWKGHLKSLSWGYKHDFNSVLSFDFRLSVVRGICNLIVDGILLGVNIDGFDEKKEFKTEYDKKTYQKTLWFLWNFFWKEDNKAFGYRFLDITTRIFACTLFNSEASSGSTYTPLVQRLLSLILWDFVSLNLNFYLTDNLFITINFVGLFKFIPNLIAEIMASSFYNEKMNKKEKKKIIIHED